VDIIKTTVWRKTSPGLGLGKETTNSSTCMAFFKLPLFITLCGLVKIIGPKRRFRLIDLFNLAFPQPTDSDRHAKCLFLFHIFLFINPLLLIDSGISQSGV